VLCSISSPQDNFSKVVKTAHHFFITICVACGSGEMEVNMKKRFITIAFATIFQDAGEATRAIEIAKNIDKYKPEYLDIAIVFISRGSRFEQKALDAGFKIYRAKPAMSGVGLYQDLKMKPGELVGEKQIAFDLLSGEIEAYQDIKPDIVIYGFWPIGGIARRMLDKTIPGICFIPLPLTEAFFDDLSDVPEQMEILSFLPPHIRLKLIKNIPKFIKKRLPLLRHNNIRVAANKLGWHGESLTNIFCMLKADLTIVNDLPDYYDIQKYKEDICFTGPLFAQSADEENLEPQISEVLGQDIDRIKVFCTLGSSGTKEQLIEIIKVFIEGAGLEWNAVILSPSPVCPLQEAQAYINNRKGIYITDKFVPARKINALADITICHGGQGTVQTAIASGTPIVAVAMQPEQQMNLEHIAAYGAAIRVPYKKWRSDVIREAVCTILSNDNYKKSADLLMNQMSHMDGGKECATVIWHKAVDLLGLKN
jgi:UDP:flavonoid glycosyltransferase YjiC (YdhE family)